MCGIAGAVHHRLTPPLTEEQLRRMGDALAHRGPDDSGEHVAPGVGLASRRLAVLDLSERGHMPMTSADGRYTIVHNGEVYNYRDLRPALQARGHHFRSDTDTEVLLYLYAEHGPEMLDRLNGMFAFAVWDARERALFLARDRLGVKPLYYVERGDALHFASEEKALFAAGVPAEFDPGTWEELVCFRYVSGERTPFRGVRRLLPGHYLVWKEGTSSQRRWWHLGEKTRERREEPPAQPSAWFRETLEDAVALRRISDVPVGVLLSGGLDSSSVAALAAEQAGSGVASFTVRFPEKEYDEGPLAREVADQWRLDYHELYVTPRDLIDRLSRAAWLHDEPLAHGNDPHIWAISEYAKPHVTVLLSGEGADETLGGYVRYQPLRYPGLLRAVRPVLPSLQAAFRLGGRLGKLSQFMGLDSLQDFALYNACNLLPSDLRALGMETTSDYPYRRRVLDEAAALYPREPVRQAMYLDQHTFLCSLLDRNDRMTMGASIECRTPFLDYRLVEGLAALPTRTLFAGRRGKEMLRRALGERLPDSVRRHRKWGFSVPWNRYLRQEQELRASLEALPSSPPFDNGPFDRKALQGAVSRFLAGDDTQSLLVRQLHTMLVWHKACCRSSRTPPRAPSLAPS